MCFLVTAPKKAEIDATRHNNVLGDLQQGEGSELRFWKVFSRQLLTSSRNVLQIARLSFFQSSSPGALGSICWSLLDQLNSFSRAPAVLVPLDFFLPTTARRSQ
jgi:hypothetical protein